MCNALLATAGLPQHRPNGNVEPPLITAGNDFTAVAALIADLPADQAFYPARAVIDYLRGATPTPDASRAGMSRAKILAEES